MFIHVFIYLYMYLFIHFSYKKYKDKSVMMASRSLIQLFRTVNPSLLARKDKVWTFFIIIHNMCLNIDVCYKPHNI